MAERLRPEIGVAFFPGNAEQDEMDRAAKAALGELPGARVVMLVVVFDSEPGDPLGCLPTHFATIARPGKESVPVSFAVDALREHAAVLENYDRERIAGAEADKKGAAS